MAKQDLQQLRSQIDELNLQLLKVINERGMLVQEVGKLKGYKERIVLIPFVKG